MMPIITLPLGYPCLSAIDTTGLWVWTYSQLFGTLFKFLLTPVSFSHLSHTITVSVTSSCFLCSWTLMIRSCQPWEDNVSSFQSLLSYILLRLFFNPLPPRHRQVHNSLAYYMFCICLHSVPSSSRYSPCMRQIFVLESLCFGLWTSPLLPSRATTSKSLCETGITLDNQVLQKENVGQL